MPVSFRFAIRFLSGSLALALVACGPGTSTVDTTVYTAVSGYVSKAPLTGATCRLYNSANQVVGTVATSTNGVVDFGTTAASGALYVQCTGGTYLDEATGQTVTSSSLSSGIVVTAGTAAKMIITPLTQLAFARAGGDPSKIAAQAAIIAKAFGLGDVDILATAPTDVNTKVASLNAAGRYGAVLATIAQYMAEQALSLDETLAQLGNTINADGTLTAATAAELQQAAQDLTDPSLNLNTAVQANVLAAQSAVKAGFAVGIDGNSGLSLTAISPSSLIQGAAGSSNWTVTGTGLYTGIKLGLDGSACAKSGTANKAGTTLTGVDCSNVTTNPTASSAAVTAAVAGGTAPIIAVTLTAAPAPTLAFTVSSMTLQLGASPLTVVASSASGGAVSYSGTNNAVATVSSAGVVTPVSTGTLTVSAAQAAVQGQFAAASTSFSLTVTAKTVPTLGFATPTSKSVVLGSADFSNALSNKVCSTESSYAPTINYSSGDSTKATVDSSGKVVLKAAGTAVITATAAAQGTCAAGSQSYTLTIGKATPAVAFSSPTTTATMGGAAPTSVATVAAPANLGSGGALPSSAGLVLSYSSSNPAVATVASSGAISLVAGGATTITASVAGDANYLGTADSSAIKASYTLTIAKAAPTLAYSGVGTLGLAVGGTDATRTVSVAGLFGLAAPTGGITYFSSNTAVATVDSAGVVTGVAAGSTTINAAYAGDGIYQSGISGLAVKVTAMLALPDTGVTAAQCYATGSNALVSCSSPAAIALLPTQDGMLGLDVTTPSNTDGKLGFNYSAVGSYALTECVKDNITGLVWEGKPTTGARAASNTYTNYDNVNADQVYDFDTDIVSKPTAAQINASTNTVGYRDSVNAAALCGYTDWRLPTANELQTLVDYGVAYPGPTVDSTWLPNTVGNDYWSSSPYVGDSYYAWYVSFSYGYVYYYVRGSYGYVRLVRASQ
jgi:Protein of unknown function (DUF1566)/Bacterial Ig-like domain (group 2)